ncbi:RNA polymerase sigma factor [Algisphaera agarilytica]|uniref:RNA polymerase sigma-70 factor (ECF subfamily) n=1 Tax=Algisphaera agarilytica TaxID=1385975 RepID=A0A7X0H6F6_9BACT|nr:RNA polymerase sigma factor [Algisphaera agarilytica]MBB6430148.1 RNA polymerase sigma-70 factor (ECF subfamily) [Algisphaera agarilytica]
MPELDVAQTLRTASSGDPDAWRDLVTAYSGRVFGLLVKHCGDRELAEELTQITFVKLVDQLGAKDGYAEQGRFESWLFRIAMNKLRDEMRRRKRQARPTDMTPGAGRGESPSGEANTGGLGVFAASSDEGGLGEDPAERLSRAEQVGRLQEAIAGLPEADREILHLRHTAGLSFAQIAETLDQPLGTVLARGHRALGKLKKLMTEEEPERKRA